MNLPDSAANRRAGARMLLKTNATPALQWLRRLICVPAALFVFILSAHAAPEVVQPIGNSGGSPFYAGCPQGKFLNGFQLWTGDHVDAIQPICVETAIAGVGIGSQLYPTKFGGSGGSGPREYICPGDNPVVIAVFVATEDWVNNIHLFCGRAIATPQRTDYPMAAYDGPKFRESGCSIVGTNCDSVDHFSGTLRCPAGLVGTGIVGRSGKFLDALGLICNAPPVLVPPLVVAVNPHRKVTKEDLALAARGAVIATQDPLATQLRTQQPDGPARFGFDIGLAAAEWQTLPGPGKQKIHDRLTSAEQGGFDAAVSFTLAWTKQRIAEFALKGAAIAKADPVIADLRDNQPEGPARRGFEIGLAASEGQTLQGPGKQKVRDALPLAEQKGFTAAVNSTLTRNRQKLTDLAPRGKKLADADPLAVELRNEQPDERARLGFDIGMATAEGQTFEGPGKDARRRSLYPDEQSGFALAVSFSVDRNRHPDLARVGAAIARRDQAVATARDAQPDAIHRLGFDIASGIFGDPASGARGNTASGPGSLKIRDGLNAAAQEGFISSMNFHLSKHYGP